jgi:alpha-beta hydrolase superfamily lysophospholipase
MEDFLFKDISKILSGSGSESTLSASEKGLLCDQINIPKSDEFVLNSKEQKIHVRTYWPVQAPKAAIIYLHGYVSHTSRPVHKYVSKTFTDNNFVYITMDFHGHGHSDGLKAHIEDYVDLIDDVVTLLMALYAGPEEATYCRLKNSLADRNIPFFLMGHSM